MKEKKAEMRIVGLNKDSIFIQRKTNHYEKPWVQTTMTFDEFFKMMETEFPEYYETYIGNNDPYDRANFFYVYGNNEDETFIFK